MVYDPLRPPMSLAIDTNIMLVLLGYQCLLSKNAPSRERARVLAEIRGRADGLSPERFDDLWQLFHHASRRIATEHLIAETYGRRKLLRFQKELVWKCAMELLTDPGIEELSCPVRELYEREGYRKMLIELGPCDAGLVYTAEKQKATILTDDDPLIRWANVRSVRAIPLNQLGNY